MTRNSIHLLWSVPHAIFRAPLDHATLSIHKRYSQHSYTQILSWRWRVFCHLILVCCTSDAEQNNVVLSPAEVNQAEEAPKQIRGYQNIGSHLIEHTCPTFLSKNTFLSSVQSMNTVCQTIWSKYSWNYNKLFVFFENLEE